MRVVITMDVELRDGNDGRLRRIDHKDLKDMVHSETHCPEGAPRYLPRAYSGHVLMYMFVRGIKIPKRKK
jgi:hypothetical protein